jgi:hypothetical protein
MHLSRVHWQRVIPPREWYFYTYQATIWKVSPGDWKTDALIAFTFAEQPQDLDSFRNDPFWREHFGNDRIHQPLRNSSTSTPACRRIARSVPSGKSPG